jgi:hypothetical protein
MFRSRTSDIQALAIEVVRRHSLPPEIPARWDVFSRWRQRRYEMQLVNVPLQQLRQAVASAESSDAAGSAARN